MSEKKNVRFNGTPGGILPGAGAAGLMRHRISNTGGKVPVPGAGGGAGGPNYDGVPGIGGGGAFPDGVSLGNSERKKWKPFGAGLVEKLNPYYLVGVLLLFCAYGWVGSRPLHHMIGREVTVVVDAVVDGDTFSAHTVDHGISARFRLRQIDAPEKDQPFGVDAKNMLENLIQPDFAARGSVSAAGNREVIVLLWEQDDWGRYVVDVVTRDSVYTKVTFVQEKLVQAGLAWVFGGFSKDHHGGNSLGEMMKKAQLAKKGLFRQEKPMEPWRYRHQQRVAKEGRRGSGGSKGHPQQPRGKNYAPHPEDAQDDDAQYDEDPHPIRSAKSKPTDQWRGRRNTNQQHKGSRSRKAGVRKGHQ